MGNIHFIRIYKVYGTEYADICYEKDGYISRLVTVETCDLPKTAKAWLNNKHGINQFDKVYKRMETIYK